MWQVHLLQIPKILTEFEIADFAFVSRIRTISQRYEPIPDSVSHDIFQVPPVPKIPSVTSLRRLQNRVKRDLSQSSENDAVALLRRLAQRSSDVGECVVSLRRWCG